RSSALLRQQPVNDPGVWVRSIGAQDTVVKKNCYVDHKILGLECLKHLFVVVNVPARPALFFALDASKFSYRECLTRSENFLLCSWRWRFRPLHSARPRKGLSAPRLRGLMTCLISRLKNPT